MAKKTEPVPIDPQAVYSITLRVPGANMTDIMKGLPEEFTPEQAVLFRVFHDALPRSFSPKHFLQWYEEFGDALEGAEIVKVSKRTRLAPPLKKAAEPPVPVRRKRRR